MAVTLEGNWFKIDEDDYDEKTLLDGTDLDAIARIESTVTGGVLYFGLVNPVVDDEDEVGQ